MTLPLIDPLVVHKNPEGVDVLDPWGVQRDLQQIAGSIDPTFGGAWHYVGATGEPAFENGWVNFDAGAIPGSYPGSRLARFYRTGDRVHLAGVVKSGTMATAIFTLPAGFRPPNQMVWAVDSNGAYGAISINSAGSVIANAGSNVWMFLDGVDFRVI